MAEVRPENGYKVYFETEGERITLPVNPIEVTVQCPADNTTYNVIGVGEVIVSRTPKLMTVSFDSFFPKKDFFQSYLNDVELKEPSEYVDFFRKLQTRKTVFKLVITRGSGDRLSFDTNFRAILNDFSLTDKGGEPDDVYYSMSISEWRDAQPELLEVKTEGVTDQKGDTIEPRELVLVKQRTDENYPLKAGQEVVVSGKVYESEEQTDEMWRKTKRSLMQEYAVIGRVLPPAASGPGRRVFLTGIGWVDKADCISNNVYNTNRNINDLRGR